MILSVFRFPEVEDGGEGGAHPAVEQIILVLAVGLGANFGLG